MKQHLSFSKNELMKLVDFLKSLQYKNLRQILSRTELEFTYSYWKI